MGRSPAAGARAKPAEPDPYAFQLAYPCGGRRVSGISRRCPSAGAAVITDWRCGFRGGPSGRIATRRGRTDPLSPFRRTENDFDCS
jgi:hypothetical protein